MGALVVPTYILRNNRVLASFMSREGKVGGVVFIKIQAPRRIPLLISMSKAELLAER